MANCAHCGAPVDKGASKCPYCGSALSADPEQFASEGAYFQNMFGNSGASVSGTGSDNTGNGTDSFSNTTGLGQFFQGTGQNSDDAAAPIFMKLFAFLFPLIGLIIYLSKRKNSPVYAGSIKYWWIAGLVKNMFFSAYDSSYTSLTTLGQISRVMSLIS